jgi:cytochrome c553
MTRFFTTTSLIAAFAIGSVLPSAAFAAGDAAAGKEKFQQLCVSCHGESGKGDGPTGKALAAAGQPAPRDFTIGEFVLDTDDDGKTGTDADLKNVITKGAMVYGGPAMMAPIQGLSDQDIENLIAYIRSLKQ